MIDHGLIEVRIDALKLDDYFRGRTHDEAVRELARNIKANGMLHFPMVRWSDKKIVFGNSRIAAHLCLGRDTVRVRKVDCTDIELEIMNRAENAFRRHDKKEQQKSAKELVDLFEFKLREERADQEAKEAALPIDAPLPASKPEEPAIGRPKTVRGEARELAAAAIGATPEAVRKADNRATEAAAEASEPPWIPDGYGHPVPDKVAADARENRADLEELELQLTRLDAKVRGLDGGAMPGEWITLIRRSIGNTLTLVKHRIPSHLCPYCKGVGDCMACISTGSMSEEMFNLWETFNAKTDDVPVVPDAVFVADEYVEEQEPPQDWEPTPATLTEVLVYDDKEYQADDSE